MIVVYLVGWFILGFLGGAVAAYKGYPPIYGIVGGILFGPLGIAFALLMPYTEEGKMRARAERETRVEMAQSRNTRICPGCGRYNSITSPICPRCNHRFDEARPKSSD